MSSPDRAPARRCTRDGQCEGGQVCRDGDCVAVQCIADSECGAREICTGARCAQVECREAADSPLGQICLGGRCYNLRDLMRDLDLGLRREFALPKAPPEEKAPGTP